MIKIGLLPLYIELYDEKVPEIRPRLERFYETAAQKLEACGFEVLRVPFCRLKQEFQSAVASFEKEKAQCIVTLHMAYSPSLESAEVLAKTKLPVVVLDATDTFDFGPPQNPDAIVYCHGIHGVMDMCSLLNQNGKKFAIAAGHLDYSNAISRVEGFIKAAVAAGSLNGSRVGSVGGAFAGMGDFAVSDEEILDRFGVETVTSSPEILRKLRESVTDSEIESEINSDNNMFKRIGDFSREAHIGTTRDGLTVRKWITQENLSAFSVNFLKIGNETGLFYMPFMEACKAMGRGIGYAGEGDILTASFAGAFLKGFSDASFVEIFCPDWRGNTLFLSHMGEMNIRLTAKTPEIAEKEFQFGNSVNPIVCYGCYKSGEGVFINVFKGQNGFKLLVSPVTVEEEPDSNFKGIIRGWMRPKKNISEFLEDLSKAGATHHSILIYGAAVEQIKFFGELLNLEVVEI
jgi:L-arabinose isomerase